MKNLKAARIITLVLLLCLLIGAAIGITASAEAETPSLSIYAKNLSYNSNISIAFAVAYENIANASDIELMIWEKTPADTTSGYDHLVTTSNPTTVFSGTENEASVEVFLTPGIAPRHMANAVYVCARYNAGTESAPKYVYSQLARYSIAEYAYDVQFHADLGEKYVAFGKTLISYGSQVQALLGDTSNSPDGYYYVSLENQTHGTVDGRFGSGIFKAGDTVTLRYTAYDSLPEGYSFSGQWYSNIGGNESLVNDGEEITVNAHAVYTPVIAFDYYNSTTAGTRYDFSNTNDASAVKTYLHETDGVGSYTTDGALVTSGSAGHAVAITNTSFDGAKYNFDGSKYVFQADITYNGGTPVSSNDLKAAYVGFFSGNGNLTNNGMFAHSYLYYTDSAAESVTLYGAELQKGKTYTICAIYTVGGGFEFYVDGVKQEDYKLDNDNNLIDAQFYGFGYYARRASYQSGLSLTFDNVYMSCFEAEYESYYGNEKYAAYGKSYSFDDNDTSDVYYYGTVSSDTSRNAHVQVSDGKLVFKNTEAAGRDTLVFKANDGTASYSKGSTYVFESKISWNGTTTQTAASLDMAFIGFITDTTSTAHVTNTSMPAYDYLTFTDYNSKSGTYETMNFFGAKLARNTEYTVRIEYTVTGSKNAGIISVFVDGNYVTSFVLNNTSTLSDTTFGGFGFYTRNAAYSLDTLDITFDNVYVGAIPAN